MTINGSMLASAVTVSRDGEDLTGEYDWALWGVESNSGAYLAEVAEQLASEALDTAGAAWARNVNCEA